MSRVIAVRNTQLCTQIIEKWLCEGVRDFCVCAGARNAPIIESLHQLKKSHPLQIHSFYHENSMGYFALGLIKATGRSVVAVTTSGTAVAQLLAPTIEAHYTSLPLILLTADRPKRYRQKGAPQSIEQVGLFSHYVSQSWDIETEKELNHFLNLPHKEKVGPHHINLCLDEPLLLSDVQTKEVNEDGCDQKQMLPLILVSHLSVEQARHVHRVLKKYSFPIYLEGHSQLMGAPDLQPHRLAFLDQSLMAHFGSVIRVGGVPTHRVWRDLEKMESRISVDHFSSAPFLGLSRSTGPVQPLEALEEFLQNYLQKNFSESEWTSLLEMTGEVVQSSRKKAEKVQLILKKKKHSEPWWVSQMAESVSSSALVFLGNSMPIRQWDMIMNSEPSWSALTFDSELRERPYHRVESQRGANGIDGLISHFLGLATACKESWCFLGDLSFMYDISGLWPLKPLQDVFKDKKIRFVVINNGGGHIFSRLFAKNNGAESGVHKMFMNSMVLPHEQNMKSLADFWGLEYFCLNKEEDLVLNRKKWAICERVLIEVKPCERATEEFWWECRS